MVKLNSTLPSHYNRSLRTRTIQNENRVTKKGSRGRGRLRMRKGVVTKETPVPGSPPNADKQLVISVKMQYNQSQELLKSKSKHLKGW